MFLSGLQVAVPVDEEIGGDVLHLIEGNHVALQPFLAVDADPGEQLAALCPEVVVLVEADLIDLESPVVVLVVDLAQLHRAFLVAGQGEGGEIEQYDFPPQAAQRALLAVDVGHRHVDDSQLADLLVVEVQNDFLGLCLVAPSLGSYVLQVLAAGLARVFLVPSIGNGTQPGQVALVAHGVEEKEPVEHLEAGEVAAGGIVAVLDEIELHLRLVGIDELLDHRVALLDGKVAVLGRRAHGTLQVCQFQAKQADGVARPAPLHLVAKGHVLQAGLHADGFRAVESQVDTLVPDAQAVELGVLLLAVAQVEFPRFVQSDGIHRQDAVGQRDMLQVQGCIGSVGDVTGNVESGMLATGKEEDCQEKKYSVRFHSECAVFVVQR